MADLDYVSSRPKHTGCEWNPVEHRPARSGDLHTRLVAATTIVGDEPSWRLCAACAKLPRFTQVGANLARVTVAVGTHCVFGYVPDGRGGHERCGRERNHEGPCARAAVVAPEAEARKVRCRHCDALKWPGSDCPECGKGDY